MRLIDAEELGFRILEETSDKDETANMIYGLVINAPTIGPSVVGTEMSLPEYLEDNDIVKYENDMVTMNYNTYQDLLEPKRGRWIEASTDGAVFCSECGTEWLSEAARYYNFCPICGARMEASDD